jgi:YD repeat-containing protein
LVEVVYDDGTTIQYTYDAAGNREVTVTTLP